MHHGRYTVQKGRYTEHQMVGIPSTRVGIPCTRIGIPAPWFFSQARGLKFQPLVDSSVSVEFGAARVPRAYKFCRGVGRVCITFSRTSFPFLCPYTVGMRLLAAKRLLPSMMMATWYGKLLPLSASFTASRLSSPPCLSLIPSPRGIPPPHPHSLHCTPHSLGADRPSLA